MHKLTHFRVCPLSRSVRLALGELHLEAELIEERPWEWRAAFLALNPAGDLPVLEMQSGPILCGAYAVSEYLAEEFKSHPKGQRSVPLLPGTREDRAEIRRLVDWFHRKMQIEVSQPLIEAKVWSRYRQGAETQPSTDLLRAVRANLRYHLSYLNWLADQRNWLSGEELSFADLAAGGHLSCLDYMDEVPWAEYPAAKMWYVRLKSRRSFQPLLADRVPGAPPPLHYTDLDF